MKNKVEVEQLDSYVEQGLRDFGIEVGEPVKMYYVDTSTNDKGDVIARRFFLEYEDGTTRVLDYT